MKQALINLQKEIGVFLVALLISSTIIIVSTLYKEGATENKNLASSQLTEAKEKYFLAIDRKRLLKEFEKKYQQLEKKGVVGDEQRLNWIDIIERITKLKKIPYVKYKINKQTLVSELQLQAIYPGIDIFKSSMVLNLQLLHEGDLYTMINELDTQADGLFEVASCNLNRSLQSRGSILESHTDKNFIARCELNWYSMKPKTVANYIGQRRPQ